MAEKVGPPAYAPWDTSAGNRFAHYSAEDHSATLWIAALLGLTYVLGALLVRAVLKWRVFGLDDSAIVLSTIVATLQSTLIFVALRNGLGRVATSTTDLKFIGELVYVSRILLILSLYLAKLSLLYLLRRILSRGQKRITLLCDIIIYLTIIGGIASSLIISVGCSCSTLFEEHCPRQIMRWTVVAIVDTFLEILIFLLPILLVWRLQMRIQTKLRVITAFGFRLIVLSLNTVHLQVWIRYIKGTPSPFTIVSSLVWQQALLTASLIAATIPNLRSFIQSLSASWGGAQAGYTTKAYANGTFEMPTIGSGTSAALRNGKPDVYLSKDDRNFETQITTVDHSTTRRGSVGSGGSRDLIIRKETVFTVERS